jgi:dTDP-4-dehydrorhamnose reductase
VYHVTNQGATTWFEFARQVLAAAGMDTSRVVPISTSQLDPPRPAPRPANSVLDNLATRLAGLPPLPPWQHTLKSVLDELAGGSP